MLERICAVIQDHRLLVRLRPYKPLESYSQIDGSSRPSMTQDQASSAPFDATSKRTKPLASPSVRFKASSRVGRVYDLGLKSSGISARSSALGFLTLGAELEIMDPVEIIPPAFGAGLTTLGFFSSGLNVSERHSSTTPVSSLETGNELPPEVELLHLDVPSYSLIDARVPTDLPQEVHHGHAELAAQHLTICSPPNLMLRPGS